MRKLDLTDYQTGGEQMFAVRSSLAAVLFNQEGINPRELIARDALATRIETHPDDTLLVEEADYAKLMAGLNATNLTQVGRAAAKFVRRLLDAPVVEVEEKTS